MDERQRRRDCSGLHSELGNRQLHGNSYRSRAA
jgi:hypothetical protein